MSEIENFFDQTPLPPDDKELLTRLTDEELASEFKAINVAFAADGLSIPLAIVLENVNEIGESIDNVRSISGDIAATPGNIIATLSFLDDRERPFSFSALEDTVFKPASRFGNAVEEMRNRNADRPGHAKLKLPVELTMDPRLQLKPRE